MKMVSEFQNFNECEKNRGHSAKVDPQPLSYRACRRGVRLQSYLVRVLVFSCTCIFSACNLRKGAGALHGTEPPWSASMMLQHQENEARVDRMKSWEEEQYRIKILVRLEDDPSGFLSFHEEHRQIGALSGLRLVAGADLSLAKVS